MIYERVSLIEACTGSIRASKGSVLDERLSVCANLDWCDVDQYSCSFCGLEGHLIDNGMWVAAAAGREYTWRMCQSSLRAPFSFTEGLDSLKAGSRQ